MVILNFISNSIEYLRTSVTNWFYYPFNYNKSWFTEKLVRDVDAANLGSFKHVTLTQPQIFHHKNDGSIEPAIQERLKGYNNINIQTNVELKTHVVHKWFVVPRTNYYSKPRLDCELIYLNEGTRPSRPLEVIPEFPLPDETDEIFFYSLDDFYAWEARQPFMLTTYCIEWLSTLTSLFL